MARSQSKLNPRSDEFRANAAAMAALVDDLNARIAQMAEGGGADARAKHLARGKLLPRERVERLLDPDTPFLELAPLAGMGVYPGLRFAGIPSNGLSKGTGALLEECSA